MIATLVVLTASSTLVYVGLRLAIQSSYYADPTRRLCGTLDRAGVKANDLTNRFVRSLNELSTYLRMGPGGLREVPSDDLSMYKDIRQWWWHPTKVPAENLKAVPRFKALKLEKLGIDE